MQNQVKHLAQAALVTGLALFMMVASASAATISYTTNAAGTGFAPGSSGLPGNTLGLTLDSISGQAAMLVFTPNAASASGFPSNIDYGDFLLSCATCTTAQTSVFGAFTFNLFVTDNTDVATGEFVGSSSGGTVSSNSSTVNITWSPLTLGPGTNHALSGNFGYTVFGNSGLTAIVAPNSGTPAGDTTVQGTLNSTPEPATIGLAGIALIGISLFGRKKLARR